MRVDSAAQLIFRLKFQVQHQGPAGHRMLHLKFESKG